VRLPPQREVDRLRADWATIRNERAADYPDLGLSASCVPEGELPPVFITARFRSGSTLLWNLFRHTRGVTAYYEPLHHCLQLPPEQRPPALDPTHDGVSEYWSEYDRIDGLANWYTEPWHCRDLYLDALDWKPALAEYIQLLIRSAEGRAVLQFNRVDFRLAWLRRMFPAARLVHLFRHPRDQWLSALRDPAAVGPHDSREQFAQHDHFFLNLWVDDLVRQFPVLDWNLVEHPYGMFYLLWKLSYIWGRTYSHISIAYEKLLAEPASVIGELFEALGLPRHSTAQLAELVRQKPVAKWHAYAPAAWFARHESAAELLLDRFLGPAQSVAAAAGLRACA